MNRDKKVLVGTIIIVSLIVFSLIFLFNKWNRETARLIEEINRDIEAVSENPNLIFEEKWSEDYVTSSLNFKFINMYETPETFYPWKGNAAYFLDGYPPGVGKEGVVSVHPFNITTPSYLSQDITLGNDDYIIVATIANIAGYIDPCECSDVIFKIKIVDLDTGVEEKIYENEINAAGGWRTIYLNISDYKNKNIRFVIEGHAGGMCGDWCAEFGAVDEFYIGRLV